MHRKYAVATLCAAAILTGCASGANQPAISQGQGMLVIGAVLHDMNDAGQMGSRTYPVESMSVKSLDNGQAYNIQLTSNHGMLILPAGTYCVNSLLPQAGAPLTYCARPFFKVNSGKILVAGFFEFALNLPAHSYTLVDAFSNPQGLFDGLSQADKDTLANFSHNGSLGSDGTMPD